METGLIISNLISTWTVGMLENGRYSVLLPNGQNALDHDFYTPEGAEAFRQVMIAEARVITDI